MSRSLLPKKPHKPRAGMSQSRHMIQGFPGAGKTTFANTWPSPVYLATEPGTHLMSAAAVEIRSWGDFTAVLDELEYTGHPYTTVVIDTVDNLYARCVESVCEELGVKHVSDAPYKGWDLLKQTWTRGVHRAASLRNKEGTKLCPLFIGHTKLEPVRRRVDGRMIETGLTMHRSNLPGSGRGILHSAIDFLYGVEMDEAGERWLITQPVDTGEARYEAKGRGTPDQMLPVRVKMNFTALREAFDATFGANRNNKGEHNA